MLYTCTGKPLTFKAKPRFNVLEEFTIFDFASNARDGLINVSSSTAGTSIFLSQVSHANAAVHTAGGNE
jgi:hypothetical protein